MTNIKRALLAAGTVAALATAGTAVSAQSYGQNDWYGKAFGGATFPTEQGGTLKFSGNKADGDLKYDTGYTLGVAVGYNFRPNVALELEYAYRNADIKGDVGDKTRTNSLMLNAIYKLDGMGADAAWTPYFGAGLGGANVDVNSKKYKFDNKSVFSYQAFAGVEYAVNDAWGLLGEVRYFGTDKADMGGNSGSNLKTRFQTWDLLVGASYKF